MKKTKKITVFLSLVLILSMLMPALGCLPESKETIYAASISQTSATLSIGESLRLSINGLPEGYKVKWSSYNNNIASVTSKGLVKAKMVTGAVKITATITYNSKIKKKLSCIVTIVYPPLERTLNVNEQILGNGSRFELSVVDSDIFDKITYSSADSNIATVDNNGKVTGRGIGKTTIYAKVRSSDGTQSCELPCKVEVVPYAQSRALNYYSNAVEQYRSFELQVTNASNVDYIEYSSSNNDIVTVSNTGTSHATVTGVNIGTAYITVRIKKSGNEVESKNCRIIVREYSKFRTISASASSIIKGVSTSQITIGDLTSLDTVKYDTADKKIATVSESGLITGAGAGTTTITATVTFPTKETTKLTYNITVTDPSKPTTTTSK